MSIKFMSAVWESGPADQAERFVLLALADFANDAGECWPSVDTVAKRSCMSERNARRILRSLAENLWVEIVENRGRNKTNCYRIKADKLSGQNVLFVENRTNEAPKTGQARHENRTNDALKPDTAMSAEPLREPLREPSVKPKTRESAPVRFDEFWEAYPKKAEKIGTRTKYASVVKRGVSEQKLIDAAKRYASWLAVKDGSFKPNPKNPMTWLSKGCWEDDLPGTPVRQSTDLVAAIAAFEAAGDFGRAEKFRQQLDSPP